MHHHGQDCLKLKVDVGEKGSGKTQDKPKVEKKEKEAEEGKGKGRFAANGGVHNPSNHLSAGEDAFRKTPERGSAGHMGAMKLNSCFLSSDDPGVMQPNVQRSTGSSATQLVSFPLFFTGCLVLLVSMLH